LFIIRPPATMHGADPMGQEGHRLCDCAVASEAHQRLLPHPIQDEAMQRPGWTLRSRRTAAVAAVVASLLAACSFVGLSVQHKRLRSQLEVLLLTKSAAICGLMEEDVSYLTNTVFRELGNITSAENCLAECDGNGRCRAWTWSKGQRGPARSAAVCFLKELGEDEVPERLVQHGVVSGLKCQRAAEQRSHSSFTATTRTRITTAATTSVVSTTTRSSSTPERSSTASAPTTRLSTTVSSTTLTDWSTSATTKLATTTTTHRSSTSKSATTTTKWSALGMRELDAHASVLWRTSSGGDFIPAYQNGLTTRCGAVKDGVDYWTKLPLYQLQDIAGPEECCRECQAEPACWAWTWGRNGSVQGLANVCFVKGLQAFDEEPEEHANPHVLSGRACRTMDNEPIPCNTAPEAPASCGKIKHDVDYWTSKSLSQQADMASAEDCRERCERTVGCGAWTWGKESAVPGLARVCFLKGLQMGEEPQRHHNTDVMSGLSCTFRPFASKHHSTTRSALSTTTSGTTSTHTTTRTRSSTTESATSTATSTASSTTITSTITATTSSSSRVLPPEERYQPNSLYCFTLMQPTGYEKDLIVHQHKAHVSIFACDEFAVFSSKVIDISSRVKTVAIDSDLKCKEGNGDLGILLNTEIFFAVWDKVITEKRFNVHAWTVKVDPDSVFLPSRLRMDLKHHSEGPTGVYINNCKMGLKGPLEVFSRIAVHLWAEGRHRCVEHFNKLCSGPCPWGEDKFIDQCLWKVLGVRRENDWSLLATAHCDPPDGWTDCLDVTKATFHPFKDGGDWRKCMYHAGGYSHKSEGA